MCVHAQSVQLIDCLPIDDTPTAALACTGPRGLCPRGEGVGGLDAHFMVTTIIIQVVVVVVTLLGWQSSSAAIEHI